MIQSTKYSEFSNKFKWILDSTAYPRVGGVVIFYHTQLSFRGTQQAKHQRERQNQNSRNANRGVHFAQ